MITELPGQLPATDPQDTHRVAVIEVSYEVFSHLGISIDVADTQGYLRDTGVFERIKTALLLPSSYNVLTLFTGAFRRVWLVGVESPDLPPVPDYEDAPRITPTYVRYEDGTVQLTNIGLHSGYDVSVLFESKEKEDNGKEKV